jgi:hypothetical protein
MANDLSGQGYIGKIDHVSLSIAMTIAGFFAIAVYNVIEISVMIFSTFKRRTGLYFWSLLVASWGIPVHATGFLLKFFHLCGNDYVSATLVIIGWYSMVTGQSLVLYSRLHLIAEKRRIRWVLVMIIVDFFLFHIPTTVLFYGSNSSKPYLFSSAYEIYEKIQITAFSLQEFIISAMYIWEAKKMLHSIGNIKKEEARSVMLHLILVNILMILMDITLLGTEYANEYSIETTYKSTLYSIKLKLEFAILNRLRALVKSQHQSTLSGETPSPAILPSFVREPKQCQCTGIGGIKVSRSFEVTSSIPSIQEQTSILRKNSVATELGLDLSRPADRRDS